MGVERGAHVGMRNVACDELVTVTNVASLCPLTATHWHDTPQTGPAQVSHNASQAGVITILNGHLQKESFRNATRTLRCASLWSTANVLSYFCSSLSVLCSLRTQMCSYLS